MPGGRSIWRQVAGDRHAGALAEAGQEHLHLRRRRVLRLVEDHEGIASVRPRMKASGAISISPFSMRSSPALGQHVVQRVVERAQIGIDLLACRSPGRKPSRSPASTAGRDRMMRSTRPLLEHRHRRGDGEIGLAGPGRAEPNTISFSRSAEIGGLHRRARRHVPRASVAVARTRRCARLPVARLGAAAPPRRPRPDRYRGPASGGRRGPEQRIRAPRGSMRTLDRDPVAARTMPTGSFCSMRARLRSCSPNSMAQVALSSNCMRWLAPRRAGSTPRFQARSPSGTQPRPAPCRPGCSAGTR